MKTDIEDNFVCDFCKKKFQRENSLINHSCTKKQRWMEKDTKWSTLAFLAYQRFYALTRASGKKVITMRDFIDSRYYNDFLKLGRFLSNQNVVSPEKYIDYLIKNSIRSSTWTHDSTYAKYIKEAINTENPTKGIERALDYIQKWCEETNGKISDFYSEVNTYKVVDAILSGKISPWLIYLAPGAGTLLNRLDDGQIKLISHLIDPKVWKIRKSRYKKESDEIRELLGNYGL